MRTHALERDLVPFSVNAFVVFQATCLMPNGVVVESTAAPPTEICVFARYRYGVFKSQMTGFGIVRFWLAAALPFAGMLIDVWPVMTVLPSTSKIVDEIEQVWTYCH